MQPPSRSGHIARLLLGLRFARQDFIPRFAAAEAQGDAFLMELKKPGPPYRRPAVQSAPKMWPIGKAFVLFPEPLPTHIASFVFFQPACQCQGASLEARCPFHPTHCKKLLYVSNVFSC